MPRGDYAENPQLGTWVHYQRTQYNKFQQDPSTSQMTQERIERLKSIAFEWDPLSAEWDTKFHELVAYKDTHGGSCNVPRGDYAENPQLGNWVSRQRTQYKKFQQDPSTSSMTQERIERLESIAFQWNGRSLKPNRHPSEECDDDGDDDEEEQEGDEEEEEIAESKASSESTKSRLNAELTHKKRVIYKEQGQEAKKRRVIQRKRY